MSHDDPVGEFLAGIEHAALPEDVFCRDIVLDATVPNWRFCVRGVDAVRAELGKWYADVGRFEDVKRSRIDEGELVEFTLSWRENGVPHACHQAHVLRIRDGRIATDTAFCGGRWPEPLLAQMKEALNPV
ncbi:MAG TPA: hypothetical protein VMR97_12500 [Acidimicrobiales bacterium]|nr:hypothetical protein [Acidimicrobiales bacterium]